MEAQSDEVPEHNGASPIYAMIQLIVFVPTCDLCELKERNKRNDENLSLMRLAVDDAHEPQVSSLFYALINSRKNIHKS